MRLTVQITLISVFTPLNATTTYTTTDKGISFSANCGATSVRNEKLLFAINGVDLS